MKIVINSHVDSNKALQHVLESLRTYKEFFHYEFIVVIGGFYEHEKNVISKERNITYIRCNHNSIDFTALIVLVELYHQDVHEHYLYIHDTCTIGKTFYTKLNAINVSSVSSVRINTQFSMNIGIYSQTILNTFSHFLLQQKNTDPHKSMEFKTKCVHHEDYIFKNDPNNSVLDNYNGSSVTGPTDYYNNGTLRIVEHYPNLDIYKIKANWGQGQYTLKN